MDKIMLNFGARWKEVVNFMHRPLYCCFTLYVCVCVCVCAKLYI